MGSRVRLSDKDRVTGSTQSKLDLKGLGVSIAMTSCRKSCMGQGLNKERARGTKAGSKTSWEGGAGGRGWIAGVSQHPGTTCAVVGCR